MSKSRYPLIVLKGVAMGMADVVPGVSGGTIAFITGIYEELIESIGRIDGAALGILFASSKASNSNKLGVFFTKGVPAFFKHVNGSFLLSLALGIGLSIMSLARVITDLLFYHPILIWSFFFGLILASAFYISRQVKWRGVKDYAALLAGAAVALLIGMASPDESDVGLAYVFFSGAIAICAMILPGISGSFILLLLGSYATIFGALGHLTEDIGTYLPIVAVFALGALIGLLSFSKLLRFLFKHHRITTLSVLTGFMIGSLWKVWPWKEVLATRINSKGIKEATETRNVSPDVYGQIMDVSPQVLGALCCVLLGIVVVLLLARFDTPKTKE